MVYVFFKIKNKKHKKSGEYDILFKFRKKKRLFFTRQGNTIIPKKIHNNKAAHKFLMKTKTHTFLIVGWDNMLIRNFVKSFFFLFFGNGPKNGFKRMFKKIK